LDDELGAYRNQMASSRRGASSSASIPMSPLKALIEKHADTPGSVAATDASLAIDHLTAAPLASSARSKSSTLAHNNSLSSNGHHTLLHSDTPTGVPSSAADERLGEGVERRLKQAMDRAYASYATSSFVSLPFVFSVYPLTM
jgi:hypothetical protein